MTVKSVPAKSKAPSQARPPSLPPARAQKSVKLPSKSTKSSTLHPEPSRRQRSRSSQPAIDFGSDDSDSEGNSEVATKRIRREEAAEYDEARIIRDHKAFASDGKRSFIMVHAADIPSLDKATKYEPSFAGLSDGSEIELQYPSILQKERYVH